MQKTAVCGALLAGLLLAPSVVRAVPSPITWQGSSDLGDLVVTLESAPIESTEGSILRRAAFPFDPPARVDPAVVTLPSSEGGIVHLFSGRSLEDGVRFVPPFDVGEGLADSPEGGSPGSPAPVGDQVAAPEPATVILLGFGLASLSARRLTSRKR